MSVPAPVQVHVCECSSCKDGEQELHHEINLFVSRLDEQQRRWFAALEAKRLGIGGVNEVALITGIGTKTVRRGCVELDADLEGRPVERARGPGGGRHAVEQQDPAIEKDLLEVLEPETAGNPMVVVLYKRSSLRNLRDRLKEKGHAISHPTVGRLLRKLDYSPKANVRRKEAKVSPPEREAQFAHIEEQKREHLDAGEPVISVDSKKKGIGR
jgi:hypothetical protein